MLMRMFEDVGKTIKNIAVVALALLSFGGVIAGIVLMSVDHAGLGLLILILVPLVAFVSSCVLYGFGEIVDTALVLRFRDERSGVQSTASATSGIGSVGAQKRRPYKDLARCEKLPAGMCVQCKQLRAELWKCIVKTGNRYQDRNLCRSCIDSFVIQ